MATVDENPAELAAALAAAKALGPTEATISELLASTRPTADELRRFREASQPSQALIREMVAATQASMGVKDAGQLIEATQPRIDPAAIRQMVAATQPHIDSAAVRGVIEATQPSQKAINEMLAALRPSQEAVREIINGLQPTQAAVRRIVEMTGSEVAAAARLAAEAVPGVAEPLGEVEAVAGGHDTGSFLDWLSRLEPAVRSRALLLLLRALAALLVEIYAELDERPPYHAGVILVILFYVADMLGDEQGK
jgi:hypothetical protein